ncbi:hypothetical protein ENUP19_0003G0064 [Entamoeba nuttalli]|uniref:Uncharacterized protein n=1 Tax=Entamoeba nuttalli TaxID=412467 RepID=A0ABQ0D7E7_9EUKA
MTLPNYKSLKRIYIIKRICQIKEIHCKQSQLSEEWSCSSNEEESFGTILSALFKKVSSISLQGYLLFDSQVSLLKALSSHTPQGIIISKGK